MLFGKLYLPDKAHQLNNMLWLWAPDKPWHGLKEYYPGNDYLDMIGVDIYPEKTPM
jgi:beta-mannanase